MQSLVSGLHLYYGVLQERLPASRIRRTSTEIHGTPTEEWIRMGNGWKMSNVTWSWQNIPDDMDIEQDLSQYYGLHGQERLDFATWRRTIAIAR